MSERNTPDGWWDKSDRAAPPEWIDEAARVLSRIEPLPRQRRRATLALALTTVDRAAREECAALCRGTGNSPEERRGAHRCAEAIRRSIR